LQPQEGEDNLSCSYLKDGMRWAKEDEINYV